MAVFNLAGNRIDRGGEKRIRVLSYNVGNFDDGGTSGHSGSDLAEYIASWTRFLGSCSADIALFTESRKYIDSANTTPSVSGLYANVFNSVSEYDQGNIPWNKVLATEATQTNVSKVTYVNRGSSAAGYVSAVLSINGVEVFVACTHLIHGGDENIQLRIAEMQELIAASAQYDNVIIGGDMNTASLAQLDAFTQAGYTLGNGGVFGTQNTWNSTSPTLPLDNVIIKGNKLKFRSFEVLDGTLSDHKAVIAEIAVSE